MSIKNTVCHLTSAHARGDTRIFVKQCVSLAQAGFYTYLIVTFYINTLKDLVFLWLNLKYNLFNPKK